jgi:DNA-binding NarL/FixJ family response regulator
MLADDHKIVRQGLRALLEGEPGFDVVGETEDGRSTVQLARQLRPDIIIIDVSMPDLNGIDATRLIHQEMPEVKTIGLSMHFEKRYVARMLDAGARGYLRKACTSEEVIRAIRTVLTGRYYISDGTSSFTLKDKSEFLGSESTPDITQLTPKEREVLQLVAEGKLTKEIATFLNLSAKTVEKHRHQIMEKLHIHSVAELTKFAIREGMTSLEN